MLSLNREKKPQRKKGRKIEFAKSLKTCSSPIKRIYTLPRPPISITYMYRCVFVYLCICTLALSLLYTQDISMYKNEGLVENFYIEVDYVSAPHYINCNIIIIMYAYVCGTERGAFNDFNVSYTCVRFTSGNNWWR